jgi:hypothetical protein
VRVIEKTLRLVVCVLSVFNGAVLATVIVFVRTGRCQKHIEAPCPSHELTKLLEDKEIEDTTRANVVVVIARDLVPM